MKPHTRRAIALIAGCLISKKNASHIFDYSASKHFPFSFNSSTSGVSAFDYTERAHISGGLSSIFHYKNRQYLSLQISGTNFSGFDYDERAHFSGQVNGSSISLFDYGVRAYFNYAI